MKFKLIAITVVLFFISCSSDKKDMETSRQVSTLKSDMLLQSAAYKPFSHPDRNDDVSLTVSGKTILEGIATFKVVNEKGEELHCEIFPSKELIQAGYRTANSALQEAHIREVVAGFFVDDMNAVLKKDQSYAGL